MVLPFFFLATLILRFAGPEGAKNLAGNCLPPDSNPLEMCSLEKITPACQAKNPQPRIAASSSVNAVSFSSARTTKCLRSPGDVQTQLAKAAFLSQSVSINLLRFMASSNPFFEHPILYSPYEYPTRHWELDESGQPTQRIIENRRRAEFITPIPKPRKRRGSADQQQIVFDEGKGLSTREQQYDPTSIINELRLRQG
jgi:hypothetical protein